MLRIAGILLSVICIAIVVTASAGFAYLWSQGYLDQEKLNTITSMLSTSAELIPDVPEIPEEQAQIAKEEVIDERALSILGLEARERELTLLRGLIEAKAAQIVAEKQALQSAKAGFKKELEAVEAELLSDSAEQGRGILLALPPNEAVAKLMTLDPEEAVLLMKGIADKSHAKILQEFKTQEQTPRGNEIFQAIIRGAPKRAVVQAAAEQAK